MGESSRLELCEAYLVLVEIRVTNTAFIHLSAVDCYIAIRVSSR